MTDIKVAKPKPDPAAQLERLRKRHNELKGTLDFYIEELHKRPEPGKLEQAKKDLREARNQIIQMVPNYDLRQLLRNIWHLSPADVFCWTTAVGYKVIESVKEPDPPEGWPQRFYWWVPRAACPLCGDVPQHEPEGWQLPGGLRMHLFGEIRTWQCKVMKTAISIADEYAKKEKDEWEIERDKGKRNELVLEWEKIHE